MLQYLGFLFLISSSYEAPPKPNAILPKIVGGHDAYIQDFPYQASVRIYGGHYCGGALISDIYVVTAAHCVGFGSSFYYTIQLGTDQMNSGGITVNVNEIFIHPDYAALTHDNDIAILELTERIKFCDTIQPINLASADESLADGSILTITGFGDVYEGEMEGSEHLQAGYVNKISNEVCQEMNFDTPISLSMLCTYTPGADSCQGDDGGPVVANSKLHGIISWRNGCADIRFAGVSSYIPYLRDFIQDVTGL